MDDVEEVRLRQGELRAAMLAGDAGALSASIDDRPAYTGPDGTVLGKEADLSAHAAGLLRLSRLDVLAASHHSLDGGVVTMTRVNLSGTCAGRAIAGPFAYTRAWSKASGAWRVVAGHASAVA